MCSATNCKVRRRWAWKRSAYPLTRLSWRQTTFAAILHPTKFSSGGFLLGFHMGHGARDAATTHPCGLTLWLGRGGTITSVWATVRPEAVHRAPKGWRTNPGALFAGRTSRGKTDDQRSEHKFKRQSYNSNSHFFHSKATSETSSRRHSWHLHSSRLSMSALRV